jgi:hypothetical protein
MKNSFIKIIDALYQKIENKKSCIFSALPKSTEFSLYPPAFSAVKKEIGSPLEYLCSIDIPIK